jgi:BirA family biotin operon repressor/biotin-[acetyl-CoA-carboxylase] ligase
MQDSLSESAITSALQTSFIGRRVICYCCLTSTMEAAREEARQGAVEGTVVIADEQTAGRGRLGRSWLSPPGNIALSVVLYPRLSDLPALIMLASLAVVHCIKNVTGLAANIKWPNDILLNGRKVCGILIENDVQGNRVNYSIIGIGINVNLRPTEFPEIGPVATSLSRELGTDVSRLSVVRSLLVEIDQLYLALLAGESLYEEWYDNLITLGNRVTATVGQETIVGLAESVTRDGSLLLRASDGNLRQIVAGEVTLRE